MRWREAAGAVAVVLTLTGCFGQSRDGILGGGASAKDWTRAVEQARSQVVRLRVELCGGLAYGSGFFVNDHQIVTNRHVVMDSVQITAEMQDGESLPAVSAAAASTSDIGIVDLEQPHSGALRLSTASPVLGDQVMVLGYPGGGPFVASKGRMVDVLDGSKFGMQGQLAVSDAHVEPGNSGGPVIDSNGAVVGVLSAIEFEDGYAVIVPLSELNATLAGGLRPVEQSCS